MGGQGRSGPARAAAGPSLHRPRRRDHLHCPPGPALGPPAGLLCRASLSGSRLGPGGPRRSPLLGPGGLQEAERSGPLSLAPGQRLRLPRPAGLPHLLDRPDRRHHQQRLPPGASGAAPPRHPRALDHGPRLLLCGKKKPKDSPHRQERAASSSSPHSLRMPPGRTSLPRFARPTSCSSRPTGPAAWSPTRAPAATGPFSRTIRIGSSPSSEPDADLEAELPRVLVGVEGAERIAVPGVDPESPSARS